MIKASEYVREQLWKKSLKFQTATYRSAGACVEDEGLKSVLDLGCGGTAKLFEFIYPWTKDITGVDVGIVIQGVKDLPVGKWISWDLNDSSLDLGRVYDLIISADCIEHLDNYEALLEIARRHMNIDSFFVISTPDCSDNIKQENIDHKQRWTFEQFGGILEKNGFLIVEKCKVPERDAKFRYNSSIFVCKLKPDVT